MPRRIAVVLFNLGGPDNLKAVRPFLFNLFNDRAIIDMPQPLRWMVAKLISTLRDKTAQHIYKQMGGSSPLLAETKAQADALQRQLSEQSPDDIVKVEVAMRYWRPFTEDAAQKVSAFEPDDIVLTPLYPQFSTTTTGSSIKVWKEAYKGGGKLHAICCYPDQAGFIEAHAERIREVLAQAPNGPIRVLFSAHGLPQKIIQRGDPYQQQIELSARTLAERLSLSDWQVSYQSRVGPMAWIGPSTVEALQQAGRDGIGVLVVPIAFVSEHSETLVELDLDYKELALKAGTPFYLRARTIGIHPSYTNALAEMVMGALSTANVMPRGTPCRGVVAQCPYQAQSRAS